MPTEDGLDTFYNPINSIPVGTDLNAAPVVEAMALRLATAARKGLERVGEDRAKVAEFMAKHREFAGVLAAPVLEMHSISTDKFVSRYIDSLLINMRASVAEAIPLITQQNIIETFYEVLNEN